MQSHPLQFVQRGQRVTLAGVPPSRTLLEVLREDLGQTGTKEGCGEGDCGACTVVIGEANASGDRLNYRAINSCIRLAHSVQGMAVWTVEDIASGTQLHPVQEAMVQCHGSQCGFCTPGFVMSLFGMYQNHTHIDRNTALADLSGNLCRCTGYKPIVDAAVMMKALPPVAVDEEQVLRLLEGLQAGDAKYANYMMPKRLTALLQQRDAHPEAQVVAGCTDVGLWVTKHHKQFAKVLDITRVKELRHVEHYAHHIAIGAAVSLTDAFAALIQDRPQLKVFAHRFAGLPVRNSGTLGGNVANGSPIGDSMPLLIALGANVVLMSVRGHRELPLEKLYTGYRQNVMAKDEVLAWIKVPRPSAGEFLRAYKISKRFEDDISAICLVLNMELDENHVVTKISIGAGGVAATPVRAAKTEAALRGQTWSQATAHAATLVLRDEFQPISDMRASAAYRSQVLGNLLQRFWLDSQGLTNINLESTSV